MIISGTGHRPNKLGGYGQEVSLKLINLARSYLTGSQPTVVVTGMALGWDQALGWAAVHEGIPFTAAVPFFGQEKAWPQDSQKEYRKLLGLANKVVNVCEPGYAAWKMQVRNKWMVDNSDIVVALWDGSDGGTANCVRYAESENKRIVNLWKEFSQL